MKQTSTAPVIILQPFGSKNKLPQNSWKNNFAIRPNAPSVKDAMIRGKINLINENDLTADL